MKKQAEPDHTTESEKIETEKKKTYEKMIAVCGTKYKLITSVTHANESPFFVPLLKFTNENYDKIDLVAEDPAYVSRLNCTTVSNMGGIPRI